MTSYLWRPVPLPNQLGMLRICSLERCCWAHSWPTSIWPALSYVYKLFTNGRPRNSGVLFLDSAPRHGAAKLRSDLSTAFIPFRSNEKWKAGSMILNMITKFFTAHLVTKFKALYVGVISYMQHNSMLFGWRSGLPEETWVDFVPRLKAFTVCGFLTCQSTILRGLGESY